MLGRRSHLRVKVRSKVHWRLENTPVMGDAIVVNYSIPGIKLILDKVVDMPQESILLIESLSAEQFTGIKKVKIKWVQKVVENGQEQLHVGGDFI